MADVKFQDISLCLKLYLENQLILPHFSRSCSIASIDMNILSKFHEFLTVGTCLKWPSTMADVKFQDISLCLESYLEN